MKMARLRVRNEILKAIGMFMLEKGKVLEKREYDEFANDVPMGSGMALNHFGSWSRLLATLEGTFPDLWEEIKKAENPPPPPPPPKPEAPVKKTTLSSKKTSVKKEV
tara:strand:- start:4351 stop:4671 length:321 start_codon:yes stop_codon:yes gene_type:complete